MPSNDSRMEAQSLRKRFWRYAPLFIWIVLISFASTSQFSGFNTSRIVRPLLLWLFPNISDERLMLVHFLVRKSAHFISYAVLGWLAARAFISSSRDFLRQRWFLFALLLVIIRSLLDEYQQTFVPSRSGSLWDCLIDIAGGLASILIFSYVNNRLRTKVSPPQRSRAV